MINLNEILYFCIFFLIFVNFYYIFVRLVKSKQKYFYKSYNKVILKSYNLSFEFFLFIKINMIFIRYQLKLKGKGEKRRRRKIPSALLGLMGEANLKFAHQSYDEAIKMCMEIIRQYSHFPDPYLVSKILFIKFFLIFLPN